MASRLRTTIRLALACSLLATATSCGTRGGSTVYVVGDSTMLQVRAVSKAGAATSGCGFTAAASCLILLEPSIPDDVDVIVAAVSIWDIDATAAEVAEGYRKYHDALSTVAPVVWIEVPPLFDEKPGDESYLEAAALNAMVREALGCKLVEWSIRNAPSEDGIHYVDDGAADVAERFRSLTSDDAC